MITNALQDKTLPVYGNGANVRDWLYVKDHCRAVDLIVCKGQAGEIYNIGGSNEMRNIDIVKLICRGLGKSESLIFCVEDRKGHGLRYVVDSTKLRTELGWIPAVDFQKGIRETMHWDLDHTQWWNV